MLKTHGCGDLRAAHAGEKVTLAGWVHRRRDHGGLTFIDLRDRSGLAQVVFNPATSSVAHAVGHTLRGEWVVQVTGEVARRPQGTENAKMPTGEVEIIAGSATVLNESKTPPFYVNEDAPVDEAVRLQYRYIDLRKERMQRNMILRHRAVKFMRDFLDARGFLEIETPILIKSTPEGARDFLVPSRLQPGSFYALPQSPQQLKQLLMVAGYERYFQMARCFRDEDLRADRQPEFTQMDLEMSFVEMADVMGLVEEMHTELVRKIVPEKRLLATPFPRLDYKDAMSRYGSDKPDLRFGMEITDITGLARTTQFQVFKAAAQSGVVKGIVAPGCAGYSRKQTDELLEFVRGKGAKGLVTIALEKIAGSLEALTQEQVRSSAGRHVTIDEIKAMAGRMGATPGDLLLLVAGPEAETNAALGSLRQMMGERLKLADPSVLAFGWVVNFPLLEWRPEENRWDSPHNPFCAPIDQDTPLLDMDPGRAMAKQYDLICNGYEAGGGSIRNHKRAAQEKILALMGHDAAAREEQFGQLLGALEYGAPPHGGIATGIDRLVMLLTGEENIRQTIAFPKTQNGADLLFGAPAPVSEKQLQELSITVKEQQRSGERPAGA
ncbi:MAG: aspartate--tRNA ligase [Dehalococcoidia bacterium]|nr:aspartate--tRNA ligase [Dehalococcoidia bacterium]